MTGGDGQLGTSSAPAEETPQAMTQVAFDVSNLLDDSTVPLLSRLGRRAEDLADLAPGDSSCPRSHDGFNHLPLTPGAALYSPLQQVLLD